VWTAPYTLRAMPDVLRDEVVAKRKIVYLRHVGQGSSGLEGEDTGVYHLMNSLASALRNFVPRSVWLGCVQGAEYR
jgi:hypothetical protein